MAIALVEPEVDGLRDAVDALRQWQDDEAPRQLHPGDVGWRWTAGAEATAAAVRMWSREGRILAIGMLDGPGLLRLAVDPEAQHDPGLAHQMVADVTQPERGVLPPGKASVEAMFGGLFGVLLLSDDGWDVDEPWAPFHRDLEQPVADPGVRIEVIGPEQVSAHTAVHRSSFGSSKFTDERWHTMAGGLLYADARSLVGYDDLGSAVAAATVWSAGPGKPGLLEPMAVHRDHHGRGYGKAISVGAAAALREMGSSSAIVCTPSSNVAAVATYRSAGFQQGPDVLDLHRSA